MGAVLQRSL
ncbi:unnamed protein product [Linum tenue]|uniref:Uncharacterized protein n=1 Tax=Linum tenue TaxID=586396 RepID=A0AAV0LKB5_9ROSI|nr:unnamed protein product [Linum tenue]